MAQARLRSAFSFSIWLCGKLRPGCDIPSPGRAAAACGPRQRREEQQRDDDREREQNRERLHGYPPRT